MPLTELKPWADNPRFNEGAVPKLMKLIVEHGFAGVIIATPDGVIRAGHTRYKAVQQLGWDEIPVEWKNFPSKEAAEEYALADNKSAEWADWDHELLGKLFKRRHDSNLENLIDRTGFTKGQIKFVAAAPGEGAYAGTLRERFGAPPFSVFNTTAGDWPERKRAWIGMGIQSELGREGEAYATLSLPEFRGGEMSKKSIFDPVLCELMYAWYCPPGGQIVDPFAGGSVRGIVAGVMGYKYWGSDLGGDQIKANKMQLGEIWMRTPANKWPAPVWVHGDAAVKVPGAPTADLIFSCPPYGDLEVYSKAGADLSNMSPGLFAAAYRVIIRKCVAKLKPNRFAIFVVGNYRSGKLGYLQDLAGLTADAFAKAGAGLYNDAIMLHPLGTLPVRSPIAFEASRKLGKAHQYVMIFCKGDPKIATAAIKKDAARPARANIPKRRPQRKVK